MGTAAVIAEVGLMLKEISTETLALIEELKRAIEAVEVFINFCKDPIGFAKGKTQDQVTQALKPFTDRMDEVQKQYDKAQATKQTANDILTVVDVPRVSDRPTSGWQTGPDDEIRNGGS